VAFNLNLFYWSLNMLILLQPGIQPLGQFDLEDDDVSVVVGGEVAAFESILLDTSDGYAADVANPGPLVHLTLGKAGASAGTDRPVWGLVDEGSSAGLGGRGYGTMFGSVIGGTAGQGTGIGVLSTSGAVVVGPSTVLGSGKATLWTKPGLYGVTSDAWVSGVYAPAVNALVYGKARGSLDAERGKLDDVSTDSGVHVGYSLGEVADTSFVSTPAYYAGATPSTSEFCALYLVGCA
jgi:hypothetical protein